MTLKKVSANPLPISFKDFSKNPIVGTLFLVLVAISYLYIDVRSTFTDQISKQDVKIAAMEKKVDMCTEQLRKSDSLLSASTSKIMVLQQLGKIK
jgi:hypothetical protein